MSGTQYNMKSSKSKMSKSTKSKSQSVDRTIAPVSYGVRAVATGPRINGSDRIVIHRREFVGTATNGAATGFALTSISAATPGYDLNPSCSDLFPWLSRIAPCYERFRFNKVKFHFIPSSPTSQAGRFYAAIDYDFDDLVASTKSELMGNISSVEAAVWQECELVCNPNALNRDLPYRYVSATGRSTYIEQRTSYSGFMMCAFDTPTTNLLMDVWVEYEVELVTPVNDPVQVQTGYANAGNAPATTAVTTAVGTGFPGLPVPNVNLNPTPSSPIKVVRAGYLGVPLMTFGFGGTTGSVNYALDVSGAQGKGKLDLSTAFSVTGTTPATILNNVNVTDVEWYAFDNAGTWQGSITKSPTIFKPDTFSNVIGCTTGEVSVASKFVESLVTLALDTAVQAVPTLRYLVPIIYNSNAAFGAGFSAFGLEYRKSV